MGAKVKVLTVSCRTGWEGMAMESLTYQTLKDFEWVIVTENDLPLVEKLKTQAKNFLATTQIIPAPKSVRSNNLNASLNAGLRECLDADFVIFYQDFIELPPDCFEKLLKLANDSTFVTTLTINQPGIEPDPRAVIGEAPRECRPEEWEANVGIAPMAMVRYLGGFDEEYDNGWSWDNCNVAVRAAMLGCRFLIDPTNNPRLIAHDRIEKTKKLRLNGEFHQRRMYDIETGAYPLRLPYLDDISPTTNPSSPTSRPGATL